MLRLIHGRPKVTLEVSLINTFYFQTQGVFLVTRRTYILIFLLLFLCYLFICFSFCSGYSKKKTSKCVNCFFLSFWEEPFFSSWVYWFSNSSFYFRCFGRASHSLALHVSGIWISWLREYQMIDAYFECKR